MPQFAPHPKSPAATKPTQCAGPNRAPHQTDRPATNSRAARLDPLRCRGPRKHLVRRESFELRTDPIQHPHIPAPTPIPPSPATFAHTHIAHAAFSPEPSFYSGIVRHDEGGPPWHKPNPTLDKHAVNRSCIANRRQRHAAQSQQLCVATRAGVSTLNVP